MAAEAMIAMTILRHSISSAANFQAASRRRSLTYFTSKILLDETTPTENLAASILSDIL